MKKYTNEHEWIELKEGEATMGISEYAVEQLGDITFVELPEVGREVNKGESIAFIESVKAASDIYLPVSGEITAVNEELENKPELLNEDAEGTWILKIRPNDLSEFDTLLDEKEYKAFIASL